VQNLMAKTASSVVQNLIAKATTKE